MGRSSFENVAHFDDEAHRSTLRARKVGYRVMAVVLCAMIAGAVLDGVGLDVYGVDSATVSASGDDGWGLEVRYGTVSRPALATPFDIEVRHEGGFDDRQVTVAVSASYLSMWDENGLDPAPAEETADPERILWTFDPPDGDVLAISFDARIEPAAQEGRRGWVAVLDEGGAELVAVDFETRVRP